MFLNENAWILITISLKLVPKVMISSIAAFVQATNHYLNQWWLLHWRKYASLGLNEVKVMAWILFETKKTNSPRLWWNIQSEEHALILIIAGVFVTAPIYLYSYDRDCWLIKPGGILLIVWLLIDFDFVKEPHCYARACQNKKKLHWWIIKSDS